MDKQNPEHEYDDILSKLSEFSKLNRRRTPKRKRIMSNDKNKSAEEIVSVFALRHEGSCGIWFNYLIPSDAILALEQYKNQELTTLQQANAELQKELEFKTNGFRLQSEFFDKMRSQLNPSEKDKTLPWYEMLHKCINDKFDELKKQNAELLNGLKELRDSVTSKGAIDTTWPIQWSGSPEQTRRMLEALDNSDRLIQSHESNKQP